MNEPSFTSQRPRLSLPHIIHEESRHASRNGPATPRLPVPARVARQHVRTARRRDYCVTAPRRRAHADAEPGNRAHRLFSRHAEAGVEHRFRRHRHLETAAAIVPDVVDKAGVVPPSAVPQYQRDIYGNVKDRGPGPHVLTGPVEIKGASPVTCSKCESSTSACRSTGDSTASGPIPARYRTNSPRSGRASFPIDRQKKTAEVAKGVVVPVDKPFFGTMGVAPDPTHGPHQQRPARRPLPATSTTRT